MFSFIGIFAIIVGIIFVGLIIFIAFVFVKNIKTGKKPHIYRHDNHALQVWVSMSKVKILYDDKIVDEMSLSVGRTAGQHLMKF